MENKENYSKYIEFYVYPSKRSSPEAKYLGRDVFKFKVIKENSIS